MKDLPTLSSDVAPRFHGIRRLVGNTPLLGIDFEYRGRRRRIFAKSENLNMTGSVKDRMALHILRTAYEQGAIQPGDRIIEATSGNTGISFSAIGRALGHPVDIFMPDWMSAERVNLIKAFGATIHPVGKDEGGFVGAIARAEEMAVMEEHTFLPRQFANEDNTGAHRATTGPEIWSQLWSHRIVPDAFVAGVGTGGTVMGVGAYLKNLNPDISVHPLEPSNSPTLTTGHQVGHHRIQGISDEFIPPIVHLEELDEVIQVDDGDAILMAQRLASQLGFGVGISSGANFLGAVLAQEQMGQDAVVVTLFPDSNKKYLSTDLMQEEPARPGYLTPHIDLLEFTSFNRVCDMCYGPVELEEVARRPVVGDFFREAGRAAGLEG